jgi:hypothetical protein
MPLNTISVEAYLANDISFIADLMPSEAVQMPDSQFVSILKAKLGADFNRAINPENKVLSPLYTEGGELNSHWLKTVNMVGINVRTIGSFWAVAKYALTLQQSQNSIHLLPIWEPGVVASLYGMSSWQINPEFFSTAMQEQFPDLDTVEKQLKVLVNLLHALGFTVGMDVIPHTDRYSEQVLANPQHFEWLQRVDTAILRHENNLHELVQNLIFTYLTENFDLSGLENPPLSATHFFSDEFPEEERLQILFGQTEDYAERLENREAIIQMLYDHHFETVPATMGPPYRGLAVDTEGGTVIDEKWRVWRDYRITKPESFSRVFGPLTRYKLYENKNDNADWEIDFDHPRPKTWDYVAKHYLAVQKTYNIDFMRGDMAHVQMRPDGVPTDCPAYYDILGYIKTTIQKECPYFASFAETFLAPAGEMAYGDEIDHLEYAEADSTLGDLQSMVVGSPRFMSEFERYVKILHTRSVAPNFTIMTGDKDDPRFDAFYLKGNEARFFIALFLTEMPSYMGLGFEQRDPHPVPAPNEHYTKLYVFHLDEGKNATRGAYKWGQNSELFYCLNRMRLFAEKIEKILRGGKMTWLLMPNKDIKHKVIAWQIERYVFIVNLDIEDIVNDLEIPLKDVSVSHSENPKQNHIPKFEFSTQEQSRPSARLNEKNVFELTSLAAGECMVWLFE